MVAELARVARAFPHRPHRAERLVEAYEATLEAAPLDEGTRKALRQFFLHSSAYVIGKVAAAPEHEELAARWAEQRALDDAIGAIAAGDDHQALALAPQFASRPSVFVGLLARMVQSGRTGLIRFVIDAVEREPSLAARRFSGGTLCISHAAQAASEWSRCCCGSARTQISRTAEAIRRSTRVANECASETGPEVVRQLVRAGADVNACGGVTRATALHMAARRGYQGLPAPCSIAAQQWKRKIARAIRHCSEPSIAAGIGSRICSWSVGPA